jgi:hypothetical protein
MVGLSMALTIAVCIGSFAWIYARVDPFTRDFVDAATTAPETAATDAPPPADDGNGAAAAADNSSSSDGSEEPPPTEPPVVEAAPTDTPATFAESYRVSSPVAVNLRSLPTRQSEIVTTLAPGTALEFLGEQQDAENPAEDGRLWLKFRTQDGNEGWVREIDVERTG